MMANPTPFFLGSLYCEEEEEERFLGEEKEEKKETQTGHGTPVNYGNAITTVALPTSPSSFLFSLDFFFFFCEEDEELLSLFSKEQQERQTHLEYSQVSNYSKFIALARTEALEWILKVNAHYGFTTLTAMLSINYLDRFLCNFRIEEDKPWMIQLLAVTCLSLAAKVEETQTPLLLDLQVEDTKYLFEAKTIQRMELLVLSTLKWKMHPVTPLSFLDHVGRRLGSESSNLRWEFLKKCERLLLSVVSDARFVSYLPSVLATAAMMHVIEQYEPLDVIDCQNQLLGVLKISKEKVNDCYEQIDKLLSGAATEANRKRKRDDDADDDGGDDGDYDGGDDGDYDGGDHHYDDDELIPESPNGVIDAAGFSSSSSSSSDEDDDVGGSDGNWGVGPPAEVSSPPLKKCRITQEQHLVPIWTW